MKGVLTAKRRSLLLVVAGVLIAASANERTLAEDRAADREQISTVLAGVEDAWNRHDMHAWASLFHEDGVWTLWTGDVWTGRKAIEEGHAAVHKTIFRSSIQRERLEEMTFLGPDAALMRYCSVLTGDERAPDKVIRSRKVLVLTKRRGAWKIGWGQNTRLADSVPDSDCFVALRK